MINNDDHPNESAPPAAAEPLGDPSEGSDFAQESNQEPEVAAGKAETDSPGSLPPETTVETAENQEKVLAGRLARRNRDINGLMQEKESLVLTYVFNKVPKPYYVRWKLESNEAFSLLVALKHRRPRVKRGA